ncbi:MAG: F0F1 ATP synthase subunit epsilon [Chloroflexota bacterium]|jgi:F-type H+-transporting ATPase subunit epsilon|nr:F0F1 ATP synthase subunit epsilon [Dehalococcoidia bacterium]MDW8047731.1 F0F1 ATP synthase subunit epsilon [Chloroflexota bacterium]
MPLTVEIVTAERVVRTESGVDALIVPSIEGQLTILPRHAALMTMLEPGELIFRKGGAEEAFAVTGGFMEVKRDRVIILADAAEAAEEIDIQRAEAARARAEARIREARARGASEVDLARAQAALQRSLVRLRVAQRRRRPGPPRPG